MQSRFVTTISKMPSNSIMSQCPPPPCHEDCRVEVANANANARRRFLHAAEPEGSCRASVTWCDRRRAGLNKKPIGTLSENTGFFWVCFVQIFTQTLGFDADFASGTMDPEIDSVITFSNNMAPLALFAYYQLVLSWYPHQPESHQLSLDKWQDSVWSCSLLSDSRYFLFTPVGYGCCHDSLVGDGTFGGNSYSFGKNSMPFNTSYII